MSASYFTRFTGGFLSDLAIFYVVSNGTKHQLLEEVVACEVMSNEERM
jgi:hypothetical protein